MGMLKKFRDAGLIGCCNGIHEVGKLAIVKGDIHKLVLLYSEDDLSEYAWAIHEKDDLYWVPVKNWYAESNVSKQASKIDTRDPNECSTH